MALENKDGQILGRLEDFIVNAQSGQVTYALLSSGGFLGLHKHLKVVPPQLLSSATAKKGVLALDVGASRWRHSPRFRMNELALLGRANEKRRIYGYYDQPLAGTEFGQSTDRSVQQPPKPTGRNSDGPDIKPNAAEHLEFASTIIGKTLVTQQQQLVGQVCDLLIDVKCEKPVLAMILSDKGFDGNGTFAVPLRSLSSAANTLVIDANHKMFVEAPSLDGQAWRTAGSRPAGLIYRYPEGNSSDANRRLKKLNITKSPLTVPWRPGPICWATRISSGCWAKLWMSRRKPTKNSPTSPKQVSIRSRPKSKGKPLSRRGNFWSQ